MKKIAVFGSGNGSNFEAIVKYFGNKVQIVCVSDKKDAYILQRAKNLNIENHFIPFEQIKGFLHQNSFDLIVLAGYMRVLPPEILELAKFINIHPSILPKYKGVDAIEKTYNNGDIIAGVTIHNVCNELDSGDIIAQVEVDISSCNSLAEVVNLVHELEHKTYPAVIDNILNNQKNVLVFGSGAREHALAWKLKQSCFLNKLFLSKPNDGFKHLGQEIEFKNLEDLAKKAVEYNIDMLVVGPEVPLVEGIVDIFEKYNIPSIGVNKFWSQLESSKSFAKEFMGVNGIATAKYEVVEKIDDIKKLQNIQLPFAIKADGLTGGKGVTFAFSQEKAKLLIKEYLEGKFGEASRKIVVEEFVKGEEISLMSVWDGQNLLPFVTAKDFKRLNNSQDAPNTGGMASYCPVKLSYKKQKSLDDYIQKLQKALRSEKAQFVGVVYSGLIFDGDEIKVLEYNVRFGDPEIQSLLLHLNSDLLQIFNLALEQKLDKAFLKWKENYSACLVIAAQGYPQNPLKGCKISNINSAIPTFYAGVQKEDDIMFSNGGRVLSICNSGALPYDKIYKSAQQLDFNDKYYRYDIEIREIN